MNNNLQTTQRTKRSAAIHALEKIKQLSHQLITKDDTNIDPDYEFIYESESESNSDSDDFDSDSESDGDNIKTKTKHKNKQIKQTKQIKQQSTVTTSASIININDIDNNDDPNSFCPFCSTNYNKGVYKQLVCNACDYHACVKCIQDQWLPNNPKIDPCCPNCKTIWSRDYLIMNLSNTFIKTKLAKMFTKKYCDIDRAKLPETLENNIYEIKAKIWANKFKNNSFDDETKQKEQELKTEFYNIIEESNNVIKEYQKKGSEIKEKVYECIKKFRQFEDGQHNKELYNLMTSINPNYDISNYKNQENIIEIVELNTLNFIYDKLYTISNLNIDKYVNKLNKSDNKLNYKFPLNIANMMRAENNNSHQIQHKIMSYGKKCSLDNCNGYLNVHNNHCVVCENYTCSDCLANIGKIDKSNELRNTLTKIKELHVCNENDLKTTQLLKNDTKCCPKCDVPIFKANGCDVMWCTQCQVGFNWKSGDLITNHVNLHNPHYYQWLFSRNENNNNCNVVNNNELRRTNKLVSMLSSKVTICDTKKVLLQHSSNDYLNLIIKKINIKKNNITFDDIFAYDVKTVYRIIKIKYEDCFNNQLLQSDDKMMINDYQSIGEVFLFGHIIKLNNTKKLHNIVKWLSNNQYMYNAHTIDDITTDCEHVIRSLEENLNNNRINLLSNTISEEKYTKKCYEINNNLLYCSELLDILKTTQSIMSDMIYNLETQMTIAHNYFANVGMTKFAKKIINDTKQPYYIFHNSKLNLNVDYFVEKLIRDGEENYLDDLVKYLVHYSDVKYENEMNKNKKELEVLIDKTFDELVELINITNGLLFDMPNKYGKTNKIIAFGHGGVLMKFSTKKEYLDYIENGFKLEYMLNNDLLKTSYEFHKVYSGDANKYYNDYGLWYNYAHFKQLLGTNDIYKNVLKKM